LIKDNRAAPAEAVCGILASLKTGYRKAKMIEALDGSVCRINVQSNVQPSELPAP
jgi:hypothetical protein